MRIDVRYLDNAIKETTAKVLELQRELQGSKEWRVWVKYEGEKTKIDAREQFGRLIFNHLGFKRNPLMVEKVREEGSHRLKILNSEEAFSHVDLPFVRTYFEYQHLNKALTVYLLGIRREVVGSYIHPFFDLHTAESYRSSSSRPNFHNMPVRNKEVSQIIRRCVIPRKGCEFLEGDYGQQEVRIAACYTRDPKLIAYIQGEGDMHYDRMLDLYILTPEEAGTDKDYKMGRYCAKNMFTFPQFYGSVYSQCAPNLWEAIGKFSLVRQPDGVSLYQHLKEKGIHSLGTCSYEEEAKEGTFEHHVKMVERRMWQDVFTVYDQWKRDWWFLYQRQGGVNTLSGFRMHGWFRRNQVLCDPIQGTAFHCLLWTDIQMDRWLLNRKFKTRMVNQIHDSTLFDGPASEREDVIQAFKEFGVKKVAKHWDWIVVPLEVEFEVAAANWHDKVKYKT